MDNNVVNKLVQKKWHTVYIGIGSNMGDKEGNIKDALRMMNDSLTKIAKVSSFYQTKPVGYIEQDDFVNCAAEIQTLYTPKELIRFLLNIEKQLKRERIIKDGPRTIDLDVLLYDDEVSDDEEIIIPHPRMHERLFVLKPLCDIAPFVLHPVLNRRIDDLEAEVSKTQSL